MRFVPFRTEIKRLVIALGLRCGATGHATAQMCPPPPTNPLFITRNNQSKMNNWRVARCPNHTHGAERTCYSPESEQPFVACVSRAHQGAAGGGGGGCALVHHINQTIAHSPHRNRTWWCGAGIEHNETQSSRVQWPLGSGLQRKTPYKKPGHLRFVVSCREQTPASLHDGPICHA